MAVSNGEEHIGNGGDGVREEGGWGDGGGDEGDDRSDEHVAVIGMAGRFPDSPDLDAFWANLRAGRDCLRTFSHDELEALGIPPETIKLDNFVPRGTLLPDREGFDARFFGYTPKQAGIMDPQARIFLETCYEALEHGGYDPFTPGSPVGVFAGSNPNDYALLLGVPDPTDSLGAFDQLIGVDRDFVATRVSHNLGLTGPAMTIQTACSTSLVTVHAATQSLLAYECSMALAGGVSVNYRQGVGYFYQPGMILSPTGECRAFDAQAQGTTLGQGCGVVLLKRLEDAQADGDNILAVIRATAINNDGREKISYTAPSEDGQAEVITTAHVLADIESDSIGYVETHGTGTLLGDPIEVAALTRAFKPGTARTQYCAIGSAKTNFGHTDAAAGITGFIKTVLALVHGEIPPSIHFSEPNPDIDFANSPFFVNTELRPFPKGPTPRRAGVSAFGIGGTNAHVVLEEAPPTPGAAAESATRVLVLSAKSSTAADRRVTDLAEALADDDGPELAAVDHTLRIGRPLLDHRRAVVVGPDRPLAATVAGENDGSIVRGATSELDLPAAGRGDEGAGAVWLFAGQGAQYPEMGAGLYAEEEVFRAALDRVADHLIEPLGIDLRGVIFGAGDEAAERLRQTAMTQPALFALEHAMAAQLRAWGQVPRAVIGHSIGEYAAAVEAGILTWNDAATLVAERGRLMQSMQPGSMLSASIPAADLLARLPRGAELAADNSSNLSVASGPTEIIEALATRLESEGVSAQVLHTSHAFHSAMMDEAAERFEEAVAEVELASPTVPLVSNVTGRSITDDEATDPAFWAGQIRRPVRFAECLASAVETGPAAFVEIGPGRVLSTFAVGHDELVNGDATGGVLAVPTMRHPRQVRDDRVVLLEAMGRLWTGGLAVDWDLVNGEPTRRRVPLPTYPFERVEAWLPPHRHVLGLPAFGPPSETTTAAKRRPIGSWLYAPSWRREPAGDPVRPYGTTVVLAPAGEPGDRLIADLRTEGHDLVDIRPDESSGSCDEQLAEVFDSLVERQVPVRRVVHAWTAAPGRTFDTLDRLEDLLDAGVHSALACARGLAPFSREGSVRLDILTAGAYSVTGAETIRPDAAALLGPAKVIPLEYSGMRTRLIDLADGIGSDPDRAAAVVELGTDAPGEEPDAVVSLRHRHRWVPTVSVRSTTDGAGDDPFRSGGRYLIVGGLGGVGLSIARFLAEEHRASIVLTSRRGRPIATGDDDEETSRRIAVLDEIERRADRLDVVAVDATDEAAMTDLIDRVEAESGPINGVIVAAGVADQQGAIHRRSRDDMTASIASKVHGSLVLERVLAGRSLDFVMLSSSIAAALYHNRFAQVGYVTANAFVEAYALRGEQRGVRTITVAWDDWLDVGMSVRAAQDFSADYGTEVDLVDRLNSFSPVDGVTLFDRALRTDEPVLLVSPTDLLQRIAADVHVISPFLEQATDSDAPVATGDTMIELVSSVWAALLGFESFELTDDFFGLGGDSLQAARMADRLSRALGVDIPVDLIFDESALGDLVDSLDALVGETPAGGPNPDTEARHGPVVLGPAQRRFLDRATERPEHFNVSVLLRPTEPLDADHVRTSVQRLVARHQVLRLSIVAPSTDDPGRQEVTGGTDESVEVADLREAGAATDRMAEIAEEVQRSLDLEAGIVFRAVLFLLPQDEQRLLVTAHHLVSDRISLLLIIDSLAADLRALSNGRPLPPLRTERSFLDWVAAQAQAVEAQPDLLDHWVDQPWDRLLPIPLDHPESRSENRNDSVAVLTTTITDLPTGPDFEDARPDELILLGLANAVARWSGGEVALIDVMGHGRRLPVDVDVTRAVGMFITYSPTIVDVATTSVADQVAAVRTGLEYGWSFDPLIVNGLSDAQAALAERPRAEVLFNFVGRAIAADGDAILTATDEPSGAEVDPAGRRDHPVAVRADVADDNSVKLVFVYSTRLHEHATIETLVRLTIEALVDLGTEGDTAEH